MPLLGLGMLVLRLSGLGMLVLRNCQGPCTKITSRARVLCFEHSPCASAASPGAKDLLFNRWAQPTPEPNPWDALSVSSIEAAGGSPQFGEPSDAATEAAGVEMPSELSDWQCVQASEQAPSPPVSAASVPQTAGQPASVGRVVQQAVRFSDDPANAMMLA